MGASHKTDQVHAEIAEELAFEIYRERLMEERYAGQVGYMLGEEG
jgi:hypothetical protein